MVSIADVVAACRGGTSGTAQLLTWGHGSMRSRLLVVLLLSLAIVLPLLMFKQYVDWSSAFTQDRRSEMLAGATAAARNGYLLDLLEACSEPRDAELAKHACDDAMQVYTEVRIGPAVGHQDEVVARRDFSRMRIDARAAQRLRDLGIAAATRPSWQEEWAQFLRTRPAYLGLAVVAALLVLASWLAMLTWTAENRAKLFRRLAMATDGDHSIPYGDVPNLPHERIHHPDRR